MHAKGHAYEDCNRWEEWRLAGEVRSNCDSCIIIRKKLYGCIYKEGGNEPQTDREGYYGFP
jgi:hypothetical protein